MQTQLGVIVSGNRVVPKQKINDDGMIAQ